MKWKMLTPVKTRPVEERAAALTDWSVRWGVVDLGRELMRAVAVVMSWTSMGERGGGGDTMAVTGDGREGR